MLLKSRDVDLKNFLTEILSYIKQNVLNRVDLNDEKFINYLLNTMDTAFDKKIGKVILGAIKTRSELKKKRIDRKGISSKTGEYTKELLEIVEWRKEVTLEAKNTWFWKL